MENKFGKKIREARKKAGMSQKDLAIAAEVGQRTVSYIEAGRGCTVEILIKLADALGYPPAYFLG